jgi:membrane protein DedA with SNARE-associated domain
VDTLQPFVTFLTAHVYLAVFLANAIDATGLPFPGRIVLILAGTFIHTPHGLAWGVVAGTAGALLGDHVLYLAGWRGGAALLALYCRLTLGSQRCMEDTVKYFRRFGPSAILLGRFSTGVRLFAAILSGGGYISYRRFLGYDIAGSLIYVTLWIMVGHVLGEHVLSLLLWLGERRALISLIPAAILAIVVYRLWRRRRYGAAAPILGGEVQHVEGESQPRKPAGAARDPRARP